MKPLFASIAAAVLLAACQTTPPEPLRATAQLQPTKGNKTFGEATFEQVGDKVRVVIFVQGLKPGQEHGLHIHEVGDCSSGDGMSTKGTSSPWQAARASRQRERPPATCRRSVRTRQAGAMSQTNRCHHRGTRAGEHHRPRLIVHADPDDYKTQPTGNAGARIACA